MKYVLGINLGGTNVRLGIVSGEGKIVEMDREKTGKKEKKAIDQQLFLGIEELKKEGAKKGLKIMGIGLGAPGPINTKQGTIVEMPNFTEIQNWPLKKEIEEKFQLPVAMEKDSNAALLGEKWVGAAKDKKNVILLTLGTGVGGAALVDGRLLTGASGEAAEFGHITVDPNGHKCGCGKRGCLETFCGAAGILRMAKEKGIQAKESKDIFVLARENNQKALEVIKIFSFALAEALGGLINIFDPELIIFGGKTSLSQDVFWPELKKRLSEFCFRSSLKDADIVSSEIVDQAEIIGAASLIFKKLRLKNEK